MDELTTARKARDEAFDKFMEHAALESMHSVAVRKWRNEFRIYADEVRALERDILSAPIKPMYAKSN